MSHQLPLGTRPLAVREQGSYDPRAGVLRRRRAEAVRIRRRRLLLADLAAGAVLAVIGVVFAPGLAILALAAVVTLACCGAWLLAERRFAGRRRRSDARWGNG